MNAVLGGSLMLGGLVAGGIGGAVFGNEVAAVHASEPTVVLGSLVGGAGGALLLPLANRPGAGGVLAAAAGCVVMGFALGTMGGAIANYHVTDAAARSVS